MMTGCAIVGVGFVIAARQHKIYGAWVAIIGLELFSIFKDFNNPYAEDPDTQPLLDSINDLK